jgi:hypothetical protein
MLSQVAAIPGQLFLLRTLILVIMLLFTEALLWLYRSHGEHKRVLSALSEDRCVGSGALWSKNAFYNWTADYLQWLWFSGDANLSPLVLPALKPVLEYDAGMGLNVLVGSGHGRNYAVGVLGGIGMETPDVVGYLEAIQHPGRGESSTLPEALLPASTLLRKTPNILIQSGRDLSVAYLEWVVGSGTADSDVVEQYAQVLMEEIPLAAVADHSKNNLSLGSSDSPDVQKYKKYREKLQALLESSLPYRSERVMRFLPKELLHECALLLSRMGNHEEVEIQFQHHDNLISVNALCRC